MFLRLGKGNNKRLGLTGDTLLIVREITEMDPTEEHREVYSNTLKEPIWEKTLKEENRCALFMYNRIKFLST